MKIRKGFCCSVSRSVEVSSISKAREMERIANDLIQRVGDPDEYIYYTYSHEYYLGNCVFELDVHMHWNKGGRHENSPSIYMAWSKCDFEAENLIQSIIRSCFSDEA